jgi:ferredoxin
MCEFCTKHGDGRIWFKNAANYAKDLMADLERREYISEFLETTMKDGIVTLGRLETLYRKRKRLPAKIVDSIVSQAKEDHFGQVLTMEEIRDIVAKAATVVRLPCACRWASSHSEKRCCFSVSYTPDKWYADLDMTTFGLAPDEGLESVTREAAIAQMEALEKEGVVHSIWTMKTPFIGAICNCGPSDCLGLRFLSIDVPTMLKGETRAEVSPARCDGCGACEEACHFGAISSYQVSGEDKAVVNADTCYGCGLCRNACSTDALTMVDRGGSY